MIKIRDQTRSFDEILQKIAFALINSLKILPWKGLAKGGMGMAIFLFSYLKEKKRYVFIV